MKKLFFTFICLSIIIGCGQKNRGNNAQNDTTNIVQDDIIEIKSKIWVIEGDTLQMLFENIDSEEFYDDAIENINVYFKGKLIYNDSNCFSIAKDDIKFIKYKNTNYILMMKYDMPVENKWLIFEIKNQKVKIHKDIVRYIFDDIDNDGIIEVGGSGITEAICLYCDSAFYNPQRIYKLGNTLTFDSINSRKLTEEIYENFLGYEYLDSIVIRKK